MSQEELFDRGKKMLIALGSNANSHVGGPFATINSGIATLSAQFPDVKVSGFYQTPSFPAGSGPDFVNAACLFHTNLPAVVILEILHKIEADFGRERTQRWGQRTLDLDLIACGDEVLPDVATHAHWRNLPLETQKTQTPDTLILPHPRLQDRAFVLVPLADIAPDWVHPLLGQSVAEMLASLPAKQRAEIKVL